MKFFNNLMVILLTGFMMVFFLLPAVVFAQEQEEILEGFVTNILEEKLPYQKLEILITTGSLVDQKIQIESGEIPSANQLVFKKGDELLISKTKDMNDNDVFYITDFVRRRSLFWLALIFVVLVVAVGRWRGLTSLLGMGISFLVIFTFILPQILLGRNPVLIAVLGSLIIVPAAFYLSHGFNKKTTIAVISTIIALTATAILAQIFVEATKLTGFSSEEAGFLQVFKEGQVNIKGLLLAGIIVGVLGILDDITIAQAAVVQELKKANLKLSLNDLYSRAMSVGSDHIASMVNTLVLVYTGASLPLLLLFIDNPHPFSEVISYEIVAEEIVRTLVGSIGLVLAVPITTLLAAFWFSKKK